MGRIAASLYLIFAAHVNVRSGRQRKSPVLAQLEEGRHVPMAGIGIREVGGHGMPRLDEDREADLARE